MAVSDELFARGAELENKVASLRKMLKGAVRGTWEYRQIERRLEEAQREYGPVLREIGEAQGKIFLFEAED